MSRRGPLGGGRLDLLLWLLLVVGVLVGFLFAADLRF